MSKGWNDCLEILFSRICENFKTEEKYVCGWGKVKKSIPFCYIKMILEGGSVTCTDKTADFNVVGMVLQALQLI